jgi:Tfp pilus assembly protein PilO
MPAVMREVSQLSRDLGLRLTSIKPGEPESVQDCIRYPLTFRVEADLAHIVRLLYEVEQPEHRLWVEGLEIGPGPRGGSDLAATVHTATYAVRSTREAADAKT